MSYIWIGATFKAKTLLPFIWNMRRDILFSQLNKSFLQDDILLSLAIYGGGTTCSVEGTTLIFPKKLKPPLLLFKNMTVISGCKVEIICHFISKCLWNEIANPNDYLSPSPDWYSLESAAFLNFQSCFLDIICCSVHFICLSLNIVLFPWLDIKFRWKKCCSIYWIGIISLINWISGSLNMYNSWQLHSDWPYWGNNLLSQGSNFKKKNSMTFPWFHIFARRYFWLRFIPHAVASVPFIMKWYNLHVCLISRIPIRQTQRKLVTN